MPVEGRRTEMPAKHVQVYDLQTMNNERLARNANHQISNQKNTRNANTCRTNLSKNVNVNQKSQEIGEIRKIVNFISFFMTYDFVSGKEAVKELRNLHKKLKEWDRFDDPTLGERGTV